MSKPIVGRISHPVPPAPPDRGPLVPEDQIAAQYFNGLPGIKNKIRWVRSHLPASARIVMGRSSSWYESDILAYRESLRGAAAHTKVG